MSSRHFFGRTELIPISQVKVDREARQRQASLETADLESSISRIGLLHPPVVDDQLNLIAGERRFLACQRLGWQEIPVQMRDEVPPVLAQVMELEENVKREDLVWQDRVRSVERIHSLYRELEADWTMGETAEAIGLKISTVSVYLRIARDLDEEAIFASATAREAYNRLLRRDERQHAADLEYLLHEVPAELERASKELDQPSLPSELLSNGKEVMPLGSPNWSERTDIRSFESMPPAPPAVLGAPPPSGVLHESFLTWAPLYEGPKFNLLHCDFPYGVEVFAGPQMNRSGTDETYQDDPRVFESLLRCLCEQTDRLASVSAHLIFWCRLDSGPMERLVRGMFAELAPSWVFQRFPLIWHKTDNAGVSPDPKHTPRHIYETALFASRGRRPIVRVAADTYGAPTDKRLHPSCKPEPMLTHFLSMLVDEHTSLLDPTCGSGSALRAADKLGAARVLGLEANEGWAASAARELANARLLRKASREGGK